MNDAALGFRMHSGWGVLVAISAHADSFEVIGRRRIVIVDTNIPGARQPYHYAANLTIPEAQTYLANCVSSCESLAFAVIGEVVRELELRHYRLLGSAILLASGRPLPSLSKILAAHSLIHTAEGEFFRQAVKQACEDLKIPVVAIRERELGVGEEGKTAFGDVANPLHRRIASLGSSIGPPWTKDHKLAALAAFVILGSKRTRGRNQTQN
jgi:hypothetical protein